MYYNTDAVGGTGHAAFVVSNHTSCESEIQSFVSYCIMHHGRVLLVQSIKICLCLDQFLFRYEIVCVDY